MARLLGLNKVVFGRQPFQGIPRKVASAVGQAEKRVALIHRVIVPASDYPEEYAILVSDKRSIFIRQEKTRSGFVLRGEMRYGTALVTDIKPKTLEDYQTMSLESLAADNVNLSVPHDTVKSLIVHRAEPEFRKRDFFIWLTMRRQGHMFRVYDFQLNYLKTQNEESQLGFYLVPLGQYFKPRRMTQTREDILHDYAMESLEIYKKVLRSDLIVSAQAG